MFLQTPNVKTVEKLTALTYNTCSVNLANHLLLANAITKDNTITLTGLWQPLIQLTV